MRCSTFSAFLVGALTQHALASAAPGDPAPPVPDDLARAADAVADVAAVSPASADKPSSDSIDLSALGLGEGAPSFEDKLNIYGFADIGFISDLWSRELIGFPSDTTNFVLGNFNLYVGKHLTERAQFLGEVRFTLLPNGSPNANGTVVDTTALDVTNYNRQSQWGGVVIERLYFEYQLTQHLSVRAGRWLTPYGIWNIDHGSPVVLGTSRPYVVGEAFFPERQTGIELFGSHLLDTFKLGYHLTVSNGRSPTEAQNDPDKKFAFGGRLELETPWGLKLGGSYYRGRYTGVPTMEIPVPDTYREVAYAGDAQYDSGGLHIQGEVIARNRHYLGGEKRHDLGFYILAGYRFEHLWNVMPFAFYDDERPGDEFLYGALFDINVGLNFRPAPSLVFKVVGSYVEFAVNESYLSGAVLYEFAAQVSCAF